MLIVLLCGSIQDKTEFHLAPLNSLSTLCWGRIKGIRHHLGNYTNFPLSLELSSLIEIYLSPVHPAVLSLTESVKDELLFRLLFRAAGYFVILLLCRSINQMMAL